MEFFLLLKRYRNFFSTLLKICWAEDESSTGISTQMYLVTYVHKYVV